MMNVLYRPVAPLVGAHFLFWSRSLKLRAWLAACLSVLIPLTAWAQTSERDPLDMRTATPPPVYESAFSDYKPYQDSELIPWKAANDVVREFGGMAAMKGMGEGDGSAHDAHKARDSEQSKPATEPAHDESRATHKASPASHPGKPADMQTMPGHDMSKMPQKSPASAPKASPAPKPAAPATPKRMPGHGGMSH